MERNKAINLIAAVLSLISVKSFSFDWDYSEALFDFSYESIFGSKEDFESWKLAPLNHLRKDFDSAVSSEPKILSSTRTQIRDQYSITEIAMVFPNLRNDGGDLAYTVVHVKPNIIKSRKVVLAINGHGEVGGDGNGQAPSKAF